jgi:hypothetical protein
MMARAGLKAHPWRRPTQEYRVYFSCIYLASLPGATIRWALDPAGWSRPDRIHGMARSDARTITQLIFSA